MPTERTARELIGRAIADALPRPHPDHEPALGFAERFENAGYIGDRILAALAEAGYQVVKLGEPRWESSYQAGFVMPDKFYRDNPDGGGPYDVLLYPIVAES